jgi:hypothetical protein
MSYVDGADYDSTPYASDSPSIRSEFNYDNSANRLESSLTASAAPANESASRGETVYFGVSAAASTPVGGAIIGAGFYSDNYGVGAYFSSGPSNGIQGLSLSVVAGKTESLAGDSYSFSGGVARPGVVIGPGISGTAYFDPSTHRQIGSEVDIGFSVGPPIAATAAYTTTSTTEFTSLYLVYVEFLNWARYSGQTGLGDWER